jgi:1-acyl-sn-glycerol-3-phosphate acyltransferase
MGDGRASRFASARSRSQEIASGARSRSQEIARNAARLDVPWARCDAARAVREVVVAGAFGFLMGLYTRRRALGREHLAGLDTPVIFVANHSSHMDTPMILKMLPARWRQRTAVVAAADYFYRKRWIAHAVSLMFNTVPMTRQGGGLAEEATRHVNRLLSERWSLLVYPEGTRSRNGAVGRLRSGVAVLASEHRLPIVPIYVSGTHDAMPPGVNWPKLRLFRRRHRVTLTFGAPIVPGEGEHRKDVMERVRVFFAEQGAQTAPPRVRPRPPVVVPEPREAVSARAGAELDVEAARPAPLSPAA